jgi:hypothetical protein
VLPCCDYPLGDSRCLCVRHCTCPAILAMKLLARWYDRTSRCIRSRSLAISECRSSAQRFYRFPMTAVISRRELANSELHPLRDVTIQSPTLAIQFYGENSVIYHAPHDRQSCGLSEAYHLRLSNPIRKRTIRPQAQAAYRRSTWLPQATTQRPTWSKNTAVRPLDFLQRGTCD